jgi:hypothetical protein
MIANSSGRERVSKCAKGDVERGEVYYSKEGAFH